MSELAELFIRPDGEEEPIPSCALFIVAHPDDIDFGSAGTAAALTRHGVEVHYGLVTDGDAGEPADIPPHELKEIRQAEQTTAAAAVGVHDLHWLGFCDGALVADLELRKAISALIRKVKPDLVVTQSPVRNLQRIYAAHPDHLATGEAVTCAVYPDSRNAHSFPELLHEELLPHTVPRMWHMAFESPNLYVDITDTFEDKVKALTSHQSQVGHRDGLDDMIRTWSAANADAAGRPGRLFESFLSIDTR